MHFGGIFGGTFRKHDMSIVQKGFAVSSFNIIPSIRMSIYFPYLSMSLHVSNVKSLAYSTLFIYYFLMIILIKCYYLNL
jgi:hypothetical protein